MLLSEQVKVSRGSPLLTCLLEGPSGSGKTAMAATVGIGSDFPYVKILSPESKDLIYRLLCDVEHRLGTGGADQIKGHPWFKDIEWDKLYEMEAAFKPEVNGELDTQNFMKFDELNPPTTERTGSGPSRKMKRFCEDLGEVFTGFKVFEDAYKSTLSIIILDDIERLLEYVAIGPRFSNLISQTLMVLLKRLPPKGKNMLVIGTTSEVSFLESVGICDAFSVTYHVPTLKTEDAKRVLQQLKVFAEDDIDSAAEALNDMPIKRLYMVVEMAAQGEYGGSAEAIYSGKETIRMSHFYDCLQDIARY